VAKTLAQGRRILDEIFDTIEDGEGLIEAYGRGVLQEAVSRAHGRPTPQAPMAADAMGIRGSSITVLTGGAPEAVSAGSEWGSDIYTQFGPRNDGGYWLMPATESAAALGAGDAYLEVIMDNAIRGF
jgi:hypothetical protein